MTAAAIATRERPIMFSGPMVRAILDGSKTQTRRVVKGEPLRWLAPNMFEPEYVGLPENRLSPYGFAGDRLWVRERHALVADGFQITPGVAYHADGAIRWNVPMADGLTVYNAEKRDGWKWRPSIHTRREHARLVLELTDVRIEPLQAISSQDAVAEGVLPIFLDPKHPLRKATYERGTDVYDDETGEAHPDGPFAGAREGFAALWDSLNAKRGYGWDVNPWVWVLSFRRVDQ